MRLQFPLHIRYAETDKMGIIYNGNYPLYLEDARCAFLEAIGYPYEQMEKEGFLSPVINLQIIYGQPLEFGDKAIIDVGVASNRPTKSIYSYLIYKNEDDMKEKRFACKAQSAHCIVDAHTFKPLSIKKHMPRLYSLYAQALDENYLFFPPLH